MKRFLSIIKFFFKQCWIEISHHHGLVRRFLREYWTHSAFTKLFKFDIISTMSKMSKFFKLTKKERKQLIPFAKRAGQIGDRFFKAIGNLEEIMELETGIKGIEFFIADGDIVGIGNADRTMELIFLKDLEA